MASICNPETLTASSVCLQCIKGERTSEAVKTWLIAKFTGNNQTPEQLWKSVVSAGYNKLTLKQALQAIVWLLCSIAGGVCTPEAMNAASVAYQKMPWQAVQANIIYLLATSTGRAISGEFLTKQAVTLGYQDFSVKQSRLAQAYLLATYKFGAITPKQLNLDTACFQCLGNVELLALETLGTCLATGGTTPPPAGYPLYGTATFVSGSSGNVSVNYLVTYSNGVYTYAYQFSSASINFSEYLILVANSFVTGALASGNTTIATLATANIPAGAIRTAFTTATTTYSVANVLPTETQWAVSGSPPVNYALGLTSAFGATSGTGNLTNGASGPWGGTIPIPGTGAFF